MRLGKPLDIPHRWYTAGSNGQQVAALAVDAEWLSVAAG